MNVATRPTRSLYAHEQRKLKRNFLGAQASAETGTKVHFRIYGDIANAAAQKLVKTWCKLIQSAWKRNRCGKFSKIFLRVSTQL